MLASFSLPLLMRPGWQAEDRAHRLGQRSSVNVHFLLARGSLDDLLFHTLNKKLGIVSSALDGQRARMGAATSPAGPGWLLFNLARAFSYTRALFAGSRRVAVQGLPARGRRVRVPRAAPRRHRGGRPAVLGAPAAGLILYVSLECLQMVVAGAVCRVA